jgi:hypothetical protein
VYGSIIRCILVSRELVIRVELVRILLIVVCVVSVVRHFGYLIRQDSYLMGTES